MTASFDIQHSTFNVRHFPVMNLALRGIEADFGPENTDTFRRDLHPDLRAGYSKMLSKERCGESFACNAHGRN